MIMPWSLGGNQRGYTQPWVPWTRWSWWGRQGSGWSSPRARWWQGASFHTCQRAGLQGKYYNERQLSPTTCKKSKYKWGNVLKEPIVSLNWRHILLCILLASATSLWISSTRPRPSSPSTPTFSSPASHCEHPVWDSHKPQLNSSSWPDKQVNH